MNVSFKVVLEVYKHDGGNMYLVLDPVNFSHAMCYKSPKGMFQFRVYIFSKHW